MNTAPLAASTTTWWLPVGGFTLASLALAVVLVLAYRDRTEPDKDNPEQVAAHTQRRLIRSVLGGAAGIAMFVLLFWQGPWWFDSLHIRKTNLGPADGVVITGFRTGLVALAAGLIAGVTLYYTREKHRLERDQFKHAQDQFTKSQEQFETTLSEAQRRDQDQARIARDGQVTGRYVEAIKLLASSKLHERLGGIYALERIMFDSTKDHETIVEVLAAFIRTGPYEEPPPPVRAGDGPVFSSSRRPSLDDRQAACAVLARRPPKDEEQPINLAGGDLTKAKMTTAQLKGADLSTVSGNHARLNGASLDGTRFHEARLSFATFADATMTGAHLEEATLGGTMFRRSDLTDAWLPGAKGTGTNFVESTLVNAHLERVTLEAANFVDADLSDASLALSNLEGSRFRGAVLERADLTDAWLMGADLSEAKGLKVSQICQARIFESTGLPADIAADPWVQERINDCEEAREAGLGFPSWEEPEAGPDTENA
ncbi:pentapeptide repeat-containing protein [Streptomyces sp. NPDC057694]|uniref:pentapeptide repeat-containing protein n=1 Tax=Streptomyces sp. NPDC057694 TaxID=3346216 RepID=UPI003675D15B